MTGYHGILMAQIDYSSTSWRVPFDLHNAHIAMGILQGNRGDCSGQGRRSEPGRARVC